MQCSSAILETFKLEDKDDYEYEFFVLSMRTSSSSSNLKVPTEMPTYGDLKSGDFFHPVPPPLPLDQPTHSPSPLDQPTHSPSPPLPPLNAPTHHPAAPSGYKNILPPLWICGKTGYLCQEFLLVKRRSNQTIGYMAMIAKGSQRWRSALRNNETSLKKSIFFKLGDAIWV